MPAQTLLPGEPTTESVELFVCPACGFANAIHWEDKETSRTIPCLRCYWESNTVTASDPILDPDDKDGEVYTKFTEHPESHGERFHCDRGVGAKRIVRDTLTFAMISEVP